MFLYSLLIVNTLLSSFGWIIGQKRLEKEIRKLKLQLKKTMEKYSVACKEALEAKNKVILYYDF